MDEVKTIKQYAKEAKKRLKSGFWEKYKSNLQTDILRAENNGVPVSKVKEYYTVKVSEDIKGADDRKEDFYRRVKEILESEGEISDAIGRLTDRAYFETLSYEEKQRYTLKLSEDYLSAVERFNREKAIVFEK